MDNVVLDTNTLIMSISPRSVYRKIWQNFLDKKYNLCISNEVLEEYSEVLSRNIGVAVSDYIVNAILSKENVVHVCPHFRCQAITQAPDDNKFVDCAFASNARFIVTEDKHFNILKTLQFPKIDIISIDDFLKINY